MPHGSKGTQHACPGASGPVSLKNGNTISAGNCDIPSRGGTSPGRWCRTHENYCGKHDWTYSKKDTCSKCVKDKEERRNPPEDKRKRDDEDDGNRKTPKKEPRKYRQGSKTQGTKLSTPSQRKTRSATRKESDTKRSKKTSSSYFTLPENEVLTFDDCKNNGAISSWNSSSLTSCAERLDRFHIKICQQHVDLSTAVQRYLHDLVSPAES